MTPYNLSKVSVGGRVAGGGRGGTEMAGDHILTILTNFDNDKLRSLEHSYSLYLKI